MAIAAFATTSRPHVRNSSRGGHPGAARRLYHTPTPAPTRSTCNAHTHAQTQHAPAHAHHPHPRAQTRASSSSASDSRSASSPHTRRPAWWWPFPRSATPPHGRSPVVSCHPRPRRPNRTPTARDANSQADCAAGAWQSPRPLRRGRRRHQHLRPGISQLPASDSSYLCTAALARTRGGTMLKKGLRRAAWPLSMLAS